MSIECYHVRIFLFRFTASHLDRLRSLGSHTCFFTIDLPEYSTEEVMHERLIYAITCCSSIDGDGMMNEGPGDHNDSNSDDETDSDDEE